MGKPVNKTLRIAAMSAGEEIGHVSGPIVTFRGNGDPLRSLLVNIDPVQEGSGDPSPDNVRPISGWDGMTVEHTGKNLVDISRFATLYPSYCSYEDDTLTVLMGNSILYTTGIPANIPAGCVISCGITEISATNVRIRFVYDDDSITDKYAFNFPFIVPSHIKAIRLNWSTPGMFSIENFLTEYGSTPTPYTPYTGTTYPITWQSSAGTVYGGTLDVLTGKLRVTHGQIASYSGETLPGAWISSMDVYSPGTTPTIGAQVVYELATPIEYTLTPQQISSLVGENNVWADTGNVDVTYVAVGGEGGKLALLLRNRKELLIAMWKGLLPAEVGLLGSIPSFGGSFSPGVLRPGLNTQEEVEDEKDDA